MSERRSQHGMRSRRWIFGGHFSNGQTGSEDQTKQDWQQQDYGPGDERRVNARQTYTPRYAERDARLSVAIQHRSDVTNKIKRPSCQIPTPSPADGADLRPMPSRRVSWHLNADPGRNRMSAQAPSLCRIEEDLKRGEGQKILAGSPSLTTRSHPSSTAMAAECLTPWEGAGILVEPGRNDSAYLPMAEGEQHGQPDLEPAVHSRTAHRDICPASHIEGFGGHSRSPRRRQYFSHQSVRNLLTRSRRARAMASSAPSTRVSSPPLRSSSSTETALRTPDAEQTSSRLSDGAHSVRSTASCTDASLQTSYFSVATTALTEESSDAGKPVADDDGHDASNDRDEEPGSV